MAYGITVSGFVGFLCIFDGWPDFKVVTPVSVHNITVAVLFLTLLYFPLLPSHCAVCYGISVRHLRDVMIYCKVLWSCFVVAGINLCSVCTKWVVDQLAKAKPLVGKSIKADFSQWNLAGTCCCYFDFLLTGISFSGINVGYTCHKRTFDPN